MTTSFKDYLIEIVDESDFRYEPSSKHGIKVTKDSQTVASALVCENGSPTGIHDNSFIIKDHSLLLCCCDTIYSFDLPGLTLNWKKELDPATCLSIYPFKDDFIVHGEMEVKRIDSNGNVKWSFSSSDIFVTPDGTPPVTLIDDKVKLIDWQGNRYILDEDGVLVG